MFYDSQLYSTAQLSQLLQVSESTIKRWADGGILKCFKTPGGHRKFRLHDVLEFLDKNGYDQLGFLVKPQEDFEAYRVHWLIARNDWDGLSKVVEKILLAEDRDSMFSLLSHCVTRKVSLGRIFDGAVMPTLDRLSQAGAAGDDDAEKASRAIQTLTEVISRLTHLLHKKVKGHGMALLGSPHDQEHYLPLAIASLLIEEQGWTVVNLGPETPLGVLAENVDSLKPSMVLYSAQVAGDRGDFVTKAAKFAKQVKNTCRVVALAEKQGDVGKDEIKADALVDGYDDLLAYTGDLLDEVVANRKRDPVNSAD